MIELVLLVGALFVVLLVVAFFLVVLTGPALIEAGREARSDPEMRQWDANRQAADDVIVEVSDGD